MFPAQQTHRICAFCKSFVKQNKIYLCHIWTLGWRFSNMNTHSCIKIVKGIIESDVHCTYKQGREMICQPDFINKIIVHCQVKQLSWLK